MHLSYLRALILGMAGLTAVNAEALTRVENNTLNMPVEPIVPGYALEQAFAGISFNQPLGITSPPGETDRVFVVEKTGSIQLVRNISTTPVKSVFLNLASELQSRSGESLYSSSEGGLLGLAFHPNYASNGYFYVFYSVRINSQLHQRVSRFSVSGNANVADPDSEQVLIEQFDQAVNHNGGDMHFTFDGYLYISVGDEGGSNDSYDNSQRIDKDYFAGILRIDVDKRPGNLEPNPHPSVKTDGNGNAYYSVPADNPFIGATSFNGSAVNPSDVITEFYAVGLRNVWRMSFDPWTGEFYAADVGQTAREEVNLIEKGGNYGWSFYEGTRNGPDSPPPGFVQDPPIYEYTRGTGTYQGNSVTGGVVYRGDYLPELYGKYIFGDYVSGHIWSLHRHDGQVDVERLTGASGPAGFGYDPSNGDILVASLSTGNVLRLVSQGQPTNLPATLADTGVFADVVNLTPNPGVLHYEPNVAFWSDYAVKDRWFVVPDLADTITYAEEDPWTYPSGMVWIKHFEIETTRGDPDTRKRLETRLLVKNDDGVYGVSYQWNEAGTEATLAPPEGVDFNVEINDDGQLTQQTWHIPSRSECLTCHREVAGHALSFHTRQLNRVFPLGGEPGNQIDTLRDAGYLANAPAETFELPRHVAADEVEYSLESRVRSYLAVNCAYCHQPGPGNPANWNGLARLNLTQTGLINGVPNNNGGDPANRLVVPGDAAHSVLLHRISATGGFSRMPPLATNTLDPDAIALVSEWIENELPQTYLPYQDWRLANFGNTTSPEGDPDANPDGDANPNELEWLTRTDPLDRNSQWRPTLRPDGDGGFEVEFDRTLNRITQLLISYDLIDWQPLQTDANRALPAGSNAPQTLPLPTADPSIFLQFQIQE